jgi:hypothetical protein
LEDQEQLDADIPDDSSGNKSSDSNFAPPKKAIGKTENKKCVPFTNGLDLDTVTQKFRYIVEQEKEKEFLDWTPTPAFLGIIYRWSGRSKFHYFNDIYNCTEVCAVELGYSLFDYIRLRGWIFSRPAKPSVRNPAQERIEYRRLDTCLKSSLPKRRGVQQKRTAMIAKFHSMIYALYRYLEADDNEKLAPSLPLMNLHKRASFLQRVTLNTQIYHLSVAIVLYIFGHFITPSNDAGLRQLTKKIFSHCSKKKMFIGGLFDLLLYFNDDNKIKSSFTYITDLLIHPEAILNKVHNENMGVPHGPYFEFIAEELWRIFPKTGVQHDLVSNLLSNSAANNAIVRRRVGSLFLSLGQSKGAKSKKKKAASILPTTPRPKRPKFRAVIPVGLSSIGTLKHWLSIPETAATLDDTVTEDTIPFPASFEAAAACIPDTEARTGPPISTTLPPPFSFETELERRFSTFRLAEQKAIDLLGPPQVTAFCDKGTSSQCKKVLNCAAFELYLMRDLRVHEHKFDYSDGRGISSHVATLSVPPQADYISPDGFCVLRSANPIITKNFEGVPVNLAPIILFTLQHGESSALRDGICGGKRIDCGCAGQAYDSTGAPVTSVGFSVFQKIASAEERNILLASLGCIQDGIQDCLDDIQCHLGLPLLFNFQPRVDAYASHLRNKFYATRLRNEWLTIQVKCLTRRDETQTHLDKSNCTWKGYSSTAALCFIGVDAFDILWSVKFLVNSRSKIGNYFDKKDPIPQALLSSCKGYLLRLDQGYKTYEGGHEIKSLTWRNFEDFYLDDHAPWEKTEEETQFVRLPTALTRNYWMSPAIHRLTQFKESGFSKEALLEMLLLSSYQTNWSRYWVVTAKMLLLPEEDSEELEELLFHPSRVYCRIAHQLYGSWIGGKHPRFSPCGLDYNALFFGPDSLDNLWQVVEFLKTIIEWIDSLHSPTSLSDGELKLQYSHFCLSLADICKCEINEFRIQILIEMIVLAGLVTKGHHVADRGYPAKGKGSYKLLQDNKVGDESMIETMQMLGFQLGISRQSLQENLCCESRPERNEIWDCFYRGQSLFLLRPCGGDGGMAVFCKAYGKRNWIKVSPE